MGVGAEAKAEDCPPHTARFYRHVPIVYTWVNGSVPAYRAQREKVGGAAAVRAHTRGAHSARGLMLATD